MEISVKKNIYILKNVGLTFGILGIFFILSLCIENVYRTSSLIPAIFTLAVFLVAVLTDGYVYSVIAALVSVIAVNFAFTFPFFKLNFSIPENMVSAIIMLIITVVTSTLVGKVKQSERMKAETEKEKMRANLLRAVSHDLRSPLTTIYGSSSVIADKYDEITKEQVLTLAKGINEDAQWLIGMVENLLSVTKINNDNIRIKTSPVVLEELIDSVLVRFKKKYSQCNLKLDIPDEFVMIAADATLIEQVIVNIFENAVHHAIGMTYIDFKVLVDGDKVVFEIKDDGCGISPERLDNLFTGYFDKGDLPIDKSKNSMGIGLSVCATIIKAHGGTIRAYNRKEGGSCFEFTLKKENVEDE